MWWRLQGRHVILAPTGSSPPTTAKFPTTTTAPTTTASPTAIAASKTDPNIPATARAHTPAGAEAFVRHFYAQLNIALTTAKAGLISTLSGTTCKTCTAFEGIADSLASKRQHYQGEAFVVRTVASIDESEVLVVGEQPRGAVVDNKGSVVKSRTQAQLIKFSVTVHWSPETWRIREIQVMK